MKINDLFFQAAENYCGMICYFEQYQIIVARAKGILSLRSLQAYIGAQT